MQWKNKSYKDVETQDVYSDVKTSFPARNFVADETAEFDLDVVTRKLDGVEQMEVDSALSTPDAIPSSQTLNMSYDRRYDAHGHSESVFTPKVKMLTAGYVLVVLALVLAVTLIAVPVGSSFGTATSLNVEYSAVASQVEQLTVQTQTEDYEALIKRATELGYIDAANSNTLTYTEIETRPAQNFNIQTNWFDSLCDWFSNVFGG